MPFTVKDIILQKNPARRGQRMGRREHWNGIPTLLFCNIFHLHSWRTSTMLNQCFHLPMEETESPAEEVICHTASQWRSQEQRTRPFLSCLVPSWH